MLLDTILNVENKSLFVARMQHMKKPALSFSTLKGSAFPCQGILPPRPLSPLSSYFLPGTFAAYTSEPAWLCAGTMTATAPMRVNVDELICGDDVSGGGICGCAPSVLLGMPTTGLLRTCGGPPFVLGGRLCLRDGVPPML